MAFDYLEHANQLLEISQQFDDEWSMTCRALGSAALKGSGEALVSLESIATSGRYPACCYAQEELKRMGIWDRSGFQFESGTESS